MVKRYISKVERKKQILTNAKHLISEQGVLSFKISELGRMSSCSNSTIYELFQCKEDILVTIFNENMLKLTHLNNSLLDMKSLSYKEKIYVTKTFNLLSKDPETRCNTICNSFAINQFVVDHANSFLITESYRLLKKVTKQNLNMLALAISNNELASCTKDELDFFNLKILSASRGLIRMSMTKCQDELGFGIKGDTVFMLISEIIESLPWNDKLVPNINMINLEVYKSTEFLKSVDINNERNEIGAITYFHGRDKLCPKNIM